MNGIKIVGVPCGTKWVNIWFTLLIHPKTIKDIHSGSANVRFNIKCLVPVKI